MKEKRREILIDLLLGMLAPLLVGFFAFWKVLLTPGYIFAGDLSFPYDVSTYVSQFLHAWNWYSSLPTGIVNGILLMQWGISYRLGFSAELIEKLWMLENYVLAGVFMYFAIRILLPKSENKLAYYGSCTAASLFFMINKVAITSIAVPNRMLAYSLIPIVIALYIKTLRDDNNVLRNSVLVSFSMSLLIAYYSLLLFLAAFILIYQFFEILMKRQNTPLEFLKKNLMIIILFVMLNAYWIVYWIIPFFSGISESAIGLPQGGLPSIEEFTHVRFNLMDIVTLNLQFSPASLPEIGLPLFMRFLVPVIAFSSVLLYTKNWNEESYLVLVHAFLALICISFVTNNPPFNQLWFSFAQFFSLKGSSWLLFYRSQSAFVIAICYLISFLSAMFIFNILNWFSAANKIRVTTSGKIHCLHLKEKAPHISRIIGVLSIITIVTGALSPWIIYSSYPASGNLNNYITPVEIPREYKEVNLWLQSQGNLYRVWWLPQRIDIFQYFSWAPEPFGSFPEIISLKPYFSLPGYIYKQGLLEGESSYIGRALSIAGVKYAIIHTDKRRSQESISLRFSGNAEQWRALSGLQRQKDLRSVYNQSFIYVFENKEEAPLMYASPKIAFVVGGFNVFSSLLELDNFNPRDYGLVFSEQLPSSAITQFLQVSDVVFFSNIRGLEDLYFQLNKDDLIYPANYTTQMKPDEYWSGNTGQEILSYDTALVQEGDFLYGSSFAGTSAAGAQLDIPINTKATDQHEAWIRVLRSPTRGKLSVHIDNTLIGVVNTTSSYIHLEWMKIGETSLTSGSHMLRLVNENGSNTVNALLLAPQSKLQDLRTSTLNALNGKDIVVIKRNFAQALQKRDQQAYSDLRDPQWIRGNQLVAAQSFTPSYLNLSSIDAYMARIGDASNLIVELHSVDENGFPTSNILANLTIPSQEIDVAASFHKIPLKYDGLLVGKKYCILFKQQGGKADSGYDIYRSRWTSVYNGGSMISSWNGGLTWWNSAADIIFDTYYQVDKITNSLEEANSSKIKMYSWNVYNDTRQEIKGLPPYNPESVKVLSYTMPYPGKYIATVEADRPFILTLTETYNPLWLISNVKGTHFPAYSFLNGYYIEKTGKFEVIVEYAAEKYFEVGAWTSLISLAGVTLLLIYRPTLSALRVRLHRQQKSKKTMFN